MCVCVGDVVTRENGRGHVQVYDIDVNFSRLLSASVNAVRCEQILKRDHAAGRGGAARGRRRRYMVQRV